MDAPPATTVVITDTNVLINFIHIGQLTLLGKLGPWRLRLPIEVLNEFTEAEQRSEVDAAIAAGCLEIMVIDAIDALALFGTLRDLMGRGEAACLALAATENLYLASDEKRFFRLKAIELVGEARILRTEDLILQAIRCGHLCVAEADAFKEVLHTKRYAMPFRSFAELL
jgi:predicted nucleic acid-binding protein